MIKTKVNNSIFEIIKGDITKQDTEAIVNAANKRLAPGGGVAGAIHRAAGKKLWEECKKIDGCQTGEAKITKAYNLPAKYVIHTVGPIYSGSKKDKKDLISCYKETIKLAEQKNIKTISFPAISTGAFGYPTEKAAKIAIETIYKQLQNTEKIKLIRMVLYDKKSYETHKKTLDST
ncbi:MAG: O-acetyl-ADP-ribose deacetylase [Candidatus Thermoplasmatota archaeon]